MSEYFIASYDLSGDNCLEHYGVKGMRWGIRKYVDKYGKYTLKGRYKFGGEKAEKYKESELSIANKKLHKALSKGDKIKANKAMKEVKALNNMSEDDIINEQLGITQAGAIAGALGGLVGTSIAAPIVISKTRKERVERFVSDYEDMSLAELEKVFRES